LLSPLFEIKQSEDVEAEREAEEAALRALEEPDAEHVEETAASDEFVKKPKGNRLSLFLSRKAARDIAVDGAIAEADAAADTGKPELAGPDDAVTKETARQTPAGAAASASLGKNEPENLAQEPADEMDGEDSHPPPPPSDHDDHDEDQQANANGHKKHLKHDPSRERRKVAFDIEPRSYQRWKGLGLHDPVEESNTVQMKRASEVSEDTKAATKNAAVMQGIVTISRIGAVHLGVVEAKGLPKVDEHGGTKAFAMTRMLASENTTKPDFEQETPRVYEKDSMARSLKIKWYTEFEISIKTKDAWLECEVFIELSSSEVSSVGRLRMPVESIAALNGDTLDNWYLLKGADGTSRSAAVHVTARYEEQVNDPKELALMARQEREALLAKVRGQLLLIYACRVSFSGLCMG
jgi:hypothetical protein